MKTSNIDIAYDYTATHKALSKIVEKYKSADIYELELATSGVKFTIPESLKPLFVVAINDILKALQIEIEQL